MRTYLILDTAVLKILIVGEAGINTIHLGVMVDGRGGGAHRNVEAVLMEASIPG